MSQQPEEGSEPYSSINSLPSSSFKSVQSHRFRLSRKDQRRLDQLYEQISMGLLEWRKKKIEMLEQYDWAMSERVAAEEEIKVLEGIQAKKITTQRKKTEQLMLEHLRKRQKAKKKLKEETQTYRKRQQNQEKQIDLGKAQIYLSLVRARVDIESEIQKLEEEQRKLNFDSGRQSWQQLQDQVRELKQKRESLEHQFTINVVEPQVPKPDFKSMTCNQLRSCIFNWKIQNQREEIYDLLKKIKYPDQSFSQIQSYILQQQSEKEALYQDLMTLKVKLELMQEQNKKIQEMNGFQSINNQ